MSKTVGVLALQGGYAAHCRALQECGFSVVEIRTAPELDAVDGLVLPGGESTTQLKLLRRFNLWEPLDAYVKSRRPILATCAGMILSATTVTGPQQASFGWLDIDVTRNGWGRQIHSGQATADVESTRDFLGEDPLPLLFIRAPRITRLGPDVSVLATLNDEPVMVGKDHVVAASFHPELTPERRIHRTVFSALL